MKAQHETPKTGTSRHIRTQQKSLMNMFRHKYQKKLKAVLPSSHFFAHQKGTLTCYVRVAILDRQHNSPGSIGLGFAGDPTQSTHGLDLIWTKKHDCSHNVIVTRLSYIQAWVIKNNWVAIINRLGEGNTIIGLSMWSYTHNYCYGWWSSTSFPSNAWFRLGGAGISYKSFLGPKCFPHLAHRTPPIYEDEDASGA
ncbi:hypothetical protein Ocin01_08815 [Orchesella cincta]|uniref:Uncharacterized protein n=1 Tax=Orchesella cincta TaxID=48709 RepID=A0A1D2MXU1_ORCCI|nr:hypothetical protein Ocin01_08815 [Orchesella cincta]